MSYRFRPMHGLIGAALIIAATPCFATDLGAPQVDPSKPHPLPNASACGQATGVAVIAVHVNELGKPFQVQTAKTSGCEALDRSGEGAVKTWRFLPATRGGDAVAEWTAVGFQYDGKTVTEVSVSPDTDVAQQDRDRVVCKTQRPVTGSNINPTPVCLTKAQWDEQRAQTEEARKREHVPTSLGTGGSTQASH